MKLVKKASGKTTIKISKEEWLRIGNKAGWLDKRAAIVDRPNHNLSDCFGPDGKMVPDVVNGINKGIGQIKQYLSITYPDIQVISHFVVGASVTYQYSETSDIDTTVVLSVNSKDTRFKTINKWIGDNVDGEFFNKRPFQFKVNGNERLGSYENADAAYDVANQKWLKKPILQDTKDSFDSKVRQVDSPAQKFYIQQEDRIVSMITSLSKVGENALKTPQKVYRDVQNWILPQINEILNAYKKIKDKRREEYQKDPQQQNLISQNWGHGNIIYKFFEKEGYLDFFKAIKDAYGDKEVTSAELQELVNRSKELLGKYQSGFAIASTKNKRLNKRAIGS